MPAEKQFANKPSIDNGDALNPTTAINNPFTGVQDDIEQFRADYGLNGVVSGMACTFGTNTVTIASGRAYQSGNQFDGGVTLALSGFAANALKVYANGAATSAPYYAATSASLTSDQLYLGSCTFNGSTITVSDANVRVRGVQTALHEITFGETSDAGDFALVPVIRDEFIEDVRVILSSGTATVDVSLGADGEAGTTIFTTQGNRPAATVAYTIATSGVPDGDRAPDAGEHLKVDIDSIGSTATHVAVTINGRLR